MSEQPLGEHPPSEYSPGEHLVSERSDPRLRPPDPAGTQPKVDPRSLDSRPRLGAGQASFLPAPVGPPPGPPAPPTSGSSAPESPSSTPDSLVLGHPRSAASKSQHSHAPRFQFMFGALGALGACAIALVVLILSAPKATPGPPWSAWHPAENGIDPAQQIAEHVAPDYRLDNGKQIVQVTGGPPTQNGQPLTLGVSVSGQPPARLEGNSVLYRMCGGGTDCSIKEGKASVQRGLLLSREALELALYTFRYVGGVSQVIVTIPPPPTTTTTTAAATTDAATTTSTSGKSTASAKVTNHALMFRSQDVAAELGRPLEATLSPSAPRVSQMEHSIDAPLVAQLTGTRLYDYVIDEVSQGESVLLLSPPN
jgi:hypothetical protein